MKRFLLSIALCLLVLVLPAPSRSDEMPIEVSYWSDNLDHNPKLTTYTAPALACDEDSCRDDIGQLAWMPPYVAGAGVSGGAAASCASCNASNDGYVYQNPNTSDTGYNSNNTFRFAHSFTVASTKCVTGIYAEVSDSTYSISATCEIYTDTDSHPDSVVSAGFTSTITEITNSIAVNELLFSSTQTLSPGTYWAVCKNDTDGEVLIYGDDSTSPSVEVMFSVSGGAWSAYTGHGFVIGVLGCDPS